ncbi:MAG TPA: proton-conducting transporter membrane subunit, partial [Planctomycetota bacterium]
MSYFDSLLYIFPEVAMALGVCTVLGWEIFTRRRRSWESGALAMGFLAIAALLLVQRLDLDAYPAATVFGMVHVDQFATLFKLFVTSAVAVVIGYDLMDRRRDATGRGEVHFLLLTAVLGSYFLVGSTNLLLVYLGLETLGLSSYALSGMHKRDRNSAEAALKYIVYGALASGILLFGVSLLYGLTGTLELRHMVGPIQEAVMEGRGAQVALPTLLIIVGF